MEAEIQGASLKKRLIITPEDSHEARQLEVFCGNDGSLVAIVKHDPTYKYSHLEIRKETT